MSDVSVGLEITSPSTPSALSGFELKRKAVKGVWWLAITDYSRLFTQFLIKIVLARLLMPKDFGIVAMAYILINGLKVFRNFGFGAALIHENQNAAKAANTAFVLLPILGSLLSVIAFLS
ncbi:MAG: oligosaccharide flippase family protein, partial [bacterium]